MKNLALGRICLMTFLLEIGLLSLKIERKKGKVVFEDSEKRPVTYEARDDSDNDSLR